MGGEGGNHVVIVYTDYKTYRCGEILFSILVSSDASCSLPLTEKLEKEQLFPAAVTYVCIHVTTGRNFLYADEV